MLKWLCWIFGDGIMMSFMSVGFIGSVLGIGTDLVTLLIIGIVGFAVGGILGGFIKYTEDHW